MSDTDQTGPTGTRMLRPVIRVLDQSMITGDPNAETRTTDPSEPDEIASEPTIAIEGFDIQRALGQGSMGAVYLAVDKANSQTVALKVLFPHLVGDVSYIRRFQAEAEIAQRLDHPNIVKVFKLGKAISTYYITMEFIEGMNLRQLIKREGSLPENITATMGMCVASALHYAWNKESLIHRDIKPENLLVDNNGALKVCDLGIAKRVDARVAGLTRTGMMLGSPHYIAPEQAKGEKGIDFGVDIYALGATLYHAVTGHTVHSSDSEFGVMIKHATEPVKDPRTIKPDLSDQFAILLMQMLELDRNNRIHDWIKIYEALEEIQKVPTDNRVFLKVQSPAQ